MGRAIADMDDDMNPRCDAWRMTGDRWVVHFGPIRITLRRDAVGWIMSAAPFVREKPLGSRIREHDAKLCAIVETKRALVALIETMDGRF